MTAKNRQVLVGPTTALSRDRTVDSSTHPCMRNPYMHQGARCALPRVRMEARRRAATAKNQVQSDACSLRPDDLQYGRLRPPSRLCAALRPLTRQGLDCGPRRPENPTIRAKGKRKWPFSSKNYLTQQLHGSQFCSCQILKVQRSSTSGAEPGIENTRLTKRSSGREPGPEPVSRTC